MDRVEYVKLVLRRVRFLLIDAVSDFFDYFFRVISVSVAWYSADQSVANYSGPDHSETFFDEKGAEDLEKQLFKTYIASLSRTGKTILLITFKEIARLKVASDEESIEDSDEESDDERDADNH